MNLNSPLLPNQIDPLVLAALDADARDVDTSRLQAAIERRLANEAHIDVALAAAATPPLPTVRFPGYYGRQAVRAFVAVAACLAVAVGVTEVVRLSSKPANAYSLVDSAYSVMPQSADRCYRVEAKVPQAWLRSVPLLSAQEETLLWTRGDRFRVVTTHDGEQLIWGQDEERRLWLVEDAQHGLIFERDEIPKGYAVAMSYLSLDVRRLARRMLDDFDLQIQSTGRGRQGLVTVQATAKQGIEPPHFNSARLEIDPRTKAIRHLELMREVDGTVRGRFTFTLVDEAEQSSASYRLEDHLAQNGQILGSNQAAERAERMSALTQGNWKLRAPSLPRTRGK